jgi:hypothetical protein
LAKHSSAQKPRSTVAEATDVAKLVAVNQAKFGAFRPLLIQPRLFPEADEDDISGTPWVESLSVPVSHVCPICRLYFSSASNRRAHDSQTPHTQRLFDLTRVHVCDLPPGQDVVIDYDTEPEVDKRTVEMFKAAVKRAPQAKHAWQAYIAAVDHTENSGSDMSGSKHVAGQSVVRVDLAAMSSTPVTSDVGRHLDATKVTANALPHPATLIAHTNAATTGVTEPTSIECASQLDSANDGGNVFVGDDGTVLLCTLLGENPEAKHIGDGGVNCSTTAVAAMSAKSQSTAALDHGEIEPPTVHDSLGSPRTNGQVMFAPSDISDTDSGSDED